MRVVFAGTPEVALPSLTALLESRHEVVGVISRPDAAKRRSKRLVPSPVAAAGLDLGLPVLRPGHPRDPDFQAELRALAPEIVSVVAYGALVPSSALEIPAHGWVNLHFSLLPAWRGAAPVQRALMAGVSTTGVTTFLIEPSLDSGPVYRRLPVTLTPTETAGEALSRLAGLGASVLVDTLDDIESGVQPTPQPDEGVSLAPKVTVEDARLDWTRSAPALHNQIRGCSPHPGAWTTYAGDRFKILATRPATATDLAPGQLHPTRSSVLVGTGAGTLELLTVQPLGKRPMAASDWARGLRDDAPWLGRA